MPRFDRFILALSTVACLASNARADLVFEYRLAPDQNDITNMTLGANAISNLTMIPLTSHILQIVVRQTDAVIAPFFQNSTDNRLHHWGFKFEYLSGFMVHTPPAVATIGNPDPFGNVNTVGIMTGGFGGEPLTSGSDSVAGFTILRDMTVNTGAFDVSGNYALANVRITAVANGIGFLKIGDAGLTDDIGSVSNPSMDASIFDVPGGTFNLPVLVNGVPEPSSLVLAGIATAGIGYRLRRRSRGSAL